jgi:B-cell receptor-associated protein 31
MKITFIFILILFIDSVNRVYRVQVELAESNKQQGGYVPPPHTQIEAS